MRDMHSLQIPPPPRVTCEEIEDEPTETKVQPPGKWSKSNQKKKLIQAIKRQGQTKEPQTRTPTPDEQAYATLLQAEARRTNSEDVYISARKSMTVRFFIHSKAKRTEALALVDSGATENFMNFQYAKYLQLPIKRLEVPRKLFNVDGTENKSGVLRFHMDLQVQTGTQRTNL